ncbi:MAG: hypothetical protein RJA22_2434 [Verrucomicrobiota bacterium]|jgi:hypothetical protein
MVNFRHILLASLATLVIFAAGIATGHRLAQNRPAAGRGSSQAGAQMPMMVRLDQYARALRDLPLDPDQQQLVHRLITERQEYLADIVRLVDPELHEMMPKLRRDVNDVLRPEQQRELERRLADRPRRDREKDREKGGLARENNKEPRRLTPAPAPALREAPTNPPRPL